MCMGQVREVTRDIKFLHNEMFFAAAQKKYVYIYDKRGLEVHCLKVPSPFACCTCLPVLHVGLCVGVGPPVWAVCLRPLAWGGGDSVSSYSATLFS